MKTLNNFILEHLECPKLSILEHLECPKLSIIERLKLNSDSKISGIIPTKFTENIIYSENDIEIIQQYAQKLRIRPIILTNYEYDNDKSILNFSHNGINLFYDNNWETKEQLTYILLWIFEGWWKCLIMINNKRDAVVTKTGGYFKSKNVEDVCKELLIQIERTKFYDEVKKLK